MTRARDTANLIGSGNFSSTTFTATSGQTAFTISHTQGFVQVFMNGLLLDETADYTSNGTAITLTSGAAAGDEIEVVSYDTFSVGDAQTQAQADARYYTQSAADTRYVNTTGDTMTGNLGVNVSPTAALDVRRSDVNGKIAEFHQSSGYGFELSSSASLATLSSGYLQDWAFTTDAGSGAVERMRLLAGGGLTFNGDTAAANALDDYEEGTFNLTLAGYYSSPSTTQTVYGYYTKVGNMVHICCRAEPLNTTGASGHMWLTGLPFASMTPYTVLACTMDNMGTYPNSSPMAYCAGSIAYIDKHVNQGTRTAVFHNAVTNGALTITGSYRI